MANRQTDLCQGPFWSKIIRFTVPIIFTGLLQLAFNAADLIIVGQFCGSTAVAAVGATSSLTTLFVNLFMGLSVGAGVSVAQAIGSGDSRNAERSVHTAIPLAFVCGLILTVGGILLSGPMLRWMGTPENELPLSVLYMRIYFCGSTASLLYNFGGAILRATGDTKSPLIFLSVSGVLNVGLNTLFITLFQMTVDGVALATVLSQGLSATLVLIALMRRNDACKLRFRNLRFHPKPLKKILRIGVPSGIQSSLFAISNVLIQSTVNSFGSVMLAGNSAAANLGGFVYTTMTSVSQTSLNFTGQNMGARRFDNIKTIARKCLILVFGIGLFLGVLINLFAEPLLNIYITDSPEAVRYGIIRLQFIVLPYFLAGMMDVTTGVLRGMGFSVTPMTISILGVCGLRIFWIYTVFQLFPTPQCLYLSYSISWMVTFLAQFISYKTVFRKQKQQWEQRVENQEIPVS